MSSIEKFECSIVIPCLNEARTLEACIRKAQEVIEKHNLNAEIIIADNGSTDGSVEIAKRCGVHVVIVEEKGYGAALMGGINRAEGKYIIMGDADESYDFSRIFPFIEKLRQGDDLVMGCRLPSGGGNIMPGAMPWVHRWVGNPLLTGIGRLFFRSPISDFHCGLRAFTKNAYERMGLVTTGMEFATEMVVKASLKKMQVSQVPITLYKDGRMRSSHLRRWRDGWRHLRFMLMYNPLWLFFIPGAVLFSIGAMIFVTLLLSPVKFGSVRLGINTLLVSAMTVLLGFQLMSFALFTKVFATTEKFLPEDRRLNRLTSVVTLEIGIMIGIAVLLMGVGFLAVATYYWKQRHFGALSPVDSMRISIPGVTMAVLGMQIIFSSFFISILGLKRK